MKYLNSTIDFSFSHILSRDNLFDGISLGSIMHVQVYDKKAVVLALTVLKKHQAALLSPSLQFR